jgi:two-component system, OmpR family, response regulator
MAKILIVEDDASIAENVQDFLTAEHNVVEVAHTAESAHELLNSFHYDLIILDWSLPKQSGVGFLKQYRAAGGKAPVLMLTGRESLQDKELGLDSGADDYLTKPFQLREVSARVRALLRRPTMEIGTVITIADLSIDTVARSVTKGGEALELLPKEYALLELFFRNPNQYFDGDSILERVWHSESNAGPGTVRTTMARLRKKIDTDGQESLIKNDRGFGYKLEWKSLS